MMKLATLLLFVLSGTAFADEPSTIALNSVLSNGQQIGLQIAVKGTAAQGIYSYLAAEEKAVSTLEGMIYFKSAQSLECEKFVNKKIELSPIYSCMVRLDKNGITSEP